MSHHKLQVSNKTKKIIKDGLPLLIIFKKLKSNEEKLTLLKYINEAGIELITFCYHILYFKEVSLSEKKRKYLLTKLKPYQKTIRRLLFLKKDKKNFAIKRRTLIYSQSGGSLSLILGVAVPLITQLISSFIRKTK